MRSRASDRSRGNDALATPVAFDASLSPVPDPGTTGARIVIAEPDPYLAFLLELNVPGVRVHEAGSDEELAALLREPADLVMVDLGGERAHRILAAADRPKVVGITGDPAESALAAGVDGLLLRPFVPTELATVVRATLGLPVLPRSEGPAPARVHQMLGVARLGAVAIAAVLEVWGSGIGARRASLLAFAFVYATARFVVRRNGKVGAAVDIAVAAGILALTGGPASTYWPLGLVAAAAAGMSMGSEVGALCGLIISAGSLHEIFRGNIEEPAQTLAWFLIFATTGVTGGLAGRVWRIGGGEGSRVLEEANRILSTLHHIARAVPGSLDLRAVTTAALDEIRDAVGAPAAAVLVEEAGTCRVVESFGLAEPEAVAVSPNQGALARALRDGARVVERAEMLPANAAAVGDHACWLAAPMRRGSARFGLLLAACPDHALHQRNRLLLERLAEETSVAVENAQLFRNVRELSIDEERRRLAREIHDGVAQALMHVKLELDFMARHGAADSATVQGETRRLARVVDRAITDVRGMIAGLHASVAEGGLAAALRSYLRDLRGLGGPEITFLSRGTVRVAPEVQGEIFRIAQEALSNSLRHAQAQNIGVLLDGAASGLVLRIEDDGRGFRPKTSGHGGVGLVAMQDRATRLGATLTVTSRLGGGTLVELLCPEEPVGTDDARAVRSNGLEEEQTA